MSYKAEYIWIDGTEPTALLRSKTKILADGVEPPVWGFDGSSTNQAEGHASDRVLRPVFTCPDPIRGGTSVLVLCEVEEIDGTPHKSNTRALLRPIAEQVRRPGVVVRHRAGVHLLQGQPPARLPRGRLPRPAGPLLLRCRRRGRVRPRDRGDPPRPLPGRRPRDLRHQRRGHARPVGVPGRPGEPARRLRPPVDRPLAALPHRRGVRRGGHPRRQARPWRLERRRRAHQLLHQGHARGLRRHHHRLRGARRGRQARRARHASTARTSRAA